MKKGKERERTRGRSGKMRRERELKECPQNEFGFATVLVQ
jgi:hypothetical protein